MRNNSFYVSYDDDDDDDDDDDGDNDGDGEKYDNGMI